MNAYELADELQELDAKLHLIDLFKSAVMLRQQADRIAELEKQTKPLSDEEIKQIWYNLYPLSSSSYWDVKREGLAELKFARAIEERHGIK